MWMYRYNKSKVILKYIHFLSYVIDNQAKYTVTDCKFFICSFSTVVSIGLDLNKVSEMMYLTACLRAQYYKHAELVQSHLVVIRLSCSPFAVVVVVSLSMQVT
jgi:hypothetical protein